MPHNKPIAPTIGLDISKPAPKSIWRHLLPVSNNDREAIFHARPLAPSCPISRLLGEATSRFAAFSQEALIKFHADALEKVYALDLDPLKELVEPQYSPIGRPAVNQPEHFRAVTLASHYKESITLFVQRLKADDILAIACGYEPGNTPGVGTLYDYFSRLWLATTPTKVLRTPYKKKKKKLKANEKLPPDNPETVADLVERVLDGETFAHRPERLLQKILAECAVKPSAKLNLLGDTLKLTLAGDGAPLETGANPFGKKICQCKQQGIYRCSCPRSYTDACANWGWDSYHERWFYGHTLYCLSAANSFNDLPLLLHLNQASAHDSITFVPAYAQLRSIFPEFKFEKALLDSAHDAYAIYRMLNMHEIEPFIDLNERNKKNNTSEEINHNGIPVCQAGLPMLRWGMHKKRLRIKWRCPKYDDLAGCSCRQSCSTSKYGRVKYTRPEADYRLFTKTPRGSKAWKKAFVRRSSVERSLKRILVDYAIELERARSDKRWFWLATLAALNQHLDAQIGVTKNSLLVRLGLKKQAA